MATARNLKIDLSTGDLYFSGGKFALVYDDEAIAQSVRSRLLFLQGEWFLDETLPAALSFDRMFVRNPNLVELQVAVREIVLDTPGVAEINALSLVLNKAARSVTVTLSIRVDSGELIAVSTEI